MTDRPWLMRTYAGHSTASQSNALFRRNLAKGQTGLSVAFDLPTQTGYDADHVLARGEVGRVGVPVGHLGDMRALFDGIPLEQSNTSMTINATAMWLLALYLVVAEEQGADISALTGTTQNDIIKEYLSRGTYVFPPGPSVRLTTDLIAYAVSRMPKWNPVNVCSYHLAEAGATPVQEIAYALSTATTILDAVRDSGQVPPERMGEVVARTSFFVNAGVRFVEEMCKMRAFARLWDQLTRERYGITDPAQRRFRYGVQVNSLSLTEEQPENNVQRIVLEMLAVTLSRDARARAIQLPGSSRPLWSPRPRPGVAPASEAWPRADRESGDLKVVGGKPRGLLPGRGERPSPRQGGMVTAVERVPIGGGRQHVDRRPTSGPSWPQLLPGRRAEPRHAKRDRRRRGTALDRLRAEADRADVNLMDATLACARAGVTTGEWAFALREVFGEYRAPTGVPGGYGGAGSPPVPGDPGGPSPRIDTVRAAAHATARELGAGRLRLLLGKPGLDGHSNGVEQIAVRARDAGFEVVYSGIRLTPAQIAAAAVAEDVHCVGLSILSGGHAELVPDVLRRLREAGAADIPVVVGGIIPPADAARLRAHGVAAVFTPRDFGITAIIGRIVEVIRQGRQLRPWAGPLTIEPEGELI